jgi:hypothetical protein
MYCEGLSFRLLERFEDHAGFDGIMLGVPGAHYHFEFTRYRGQALRPAPAIEDLTVFYLPSEPEWKAACAAMVAAGFEQVPAFNPYWDVHGRTFRDADGYRVVLQRASWPDAQP